MPVSSASAVPAAVHPLAEEYRLLDEWEGHWRPFLNQVARVFEVGDLPTAITEVTRALGKVFTWDLNGGVRPRCHPWPACTVMATVAVATKNYYDGAFWDELWESAAIPGPHRKNHLWGEEFLRSLRTIGLLDQTRGRKYVGVALLHAGLPDHCLDNLFDQIAQWNHQHPEDEAGDLIDRLARSESSLATLDRPIRLLIEESRLQAMPLLERCALLLRAVTARPSKRTWWEEVGLPHRFHEPALRAVVRWQNREHRPVFERGDEPQLRFSPEQDEVRVVLPTGWEQSPRAGSPPESLERRGDHLRVRGPVHSVGLRDPDGVEVEVPVTEGERLLAFTHYGRRIALSGEVLPRTLWLLHEEGELELSSEVELIREKSLLDGWWPWQASSVSLPPGSSFGVRGEPPQQVSLASSPPPVVELGPPLLGVSDHEGRPVHAERPRMEVASFDGAPWEIVVFDGESDTESILSVSSLATSGAHDPLARLPPPLVGTFLLRAQRPGEGAHEWRFSLAEGMTVAHRPSPRLISKAGPEPAQSRIVPPRGLQADTSLLNHSTKRTVPSLNLYRDGRPFSLQVRAPHLELSLSRSSLWRERPLALAPEELRQRGDLLIRCSHGVTDLGGATVSLWSLEGDLLQHESPRERRDGVLALPLSRFSDVAREHHSAQVMLEVQGRECLVLRVRPAPLARSAVFTDEDTIRLEGLQGGQPLEAVLYQEQAPWREPVVLPVRGGHIPTDDRFDIGGPVRILLRVDDPWSAAPQTPLWPNKKRNTVLRCEMPGRPNNGSDRSEDLLCAYMSGQRGALRPTELLDHVGTDRVWSAVAALGAGAPSDEHERLARLITALTRDPVRALTDYHALTRPPLKALSALIATGGASTPYPEPVSEEHLVSLWERRPVVAALLSHQALRWAKDFDSPVMGAVLSRCGEEALPLLRGLPLPLERPDEEKPPLGRDLPKIFEDRERTRWPLLSPAVERRVVQDCARIDPSIRRELTKASEPALQAILGLFPRWSRSHHRTLSQLLVHRKGLCSEKTGVLPQLSLALAINARLAARRGHPGEGLHLDRFHRQGWSTMARHAPSLVAHDLVLAELAVVGLDRARLH